MLFSFFDSKHFFLCNLSETIYEVDFRQFHFFDSFVGAVKVFDHFHDLLSISDYIFLHFL